jgi:zinc transporter 5/7
MAATYALPSPSMNSHGHGEHHSHSHIRRTAPQRSPLRPASMNEASCIVNGLSTSDLLKPDMQSHHQSSHSADLFYDMPPEQAPPAPQNFKPRPSFSTPNGARTKSMERRKSVGLPTHLRLQPNGYGFPPPAPQRSRASTIEGGATKWITTAEAVSSLLIPLPYVLASLAFSPVSASQTQDDDINQLKKVGMKPELDLLTICAVTSLVLVLVGLRGTFGTRSIHLDGRKKSLGGEEIVKKPQWAHLARRVGARLITVGLPFYATSMLGAARVALVMLAGLSSNIMATEDELTDASKATGWRRLISRRRWTLGSIALQLLYDLSQITNNSSATNTCLGYLALGIATLVLPPPFPSSNPNMSIVTTIPPASTSATSAVLATPWETPPQLQSRSPQASTISPLICTPEDVNLTLGTAIALGILSGMFSIFLPSRGGITLDQVGWGLMAVSTAALALTTAKPRSLEGNKSLGLLLGSVLSSYFSIQWRSDPFSSFAFQGVFIGISFAATRLDTLTASSTSLHPQHRHQHHHHHPAQTHVVQHGEMSKLSAFLIQSVPHGPCGTLLIGILAEKDSRRIFYFMW